MSNIYPKVVLTVKKAGGDAPLPYLTLEFLNAFVTSMQTGGAADSTLTESVTINFDQVTYTYQKQKEDGSKDGGPVIATIFPTGRCGR